MKKKYVIILLAVVSITLFLLDYFVLPDTVVIQVGFDGNPTNTVPKVIASFIPVILEVVGIVTFKNGEDIKKGLIMCAIGYAAAIITIFMNM